MAIASSVLFSSLAQREKNMAHTASENPASQERTGFFVGWKTELFHESIFCIS